MKSKILFVALLLLLCSCGNKEVEIKGPYLEIKGDKVELNDLHLGDYKNGLDVWLIERRLSEVERKLFPPEPAVQTVSVDNTSLAGTKLTGWDKIDRDLEMEEFDEINDEMKKILSSGDFNLGKAEKVWKELNRHYIKTNDEKAYNEFISTVNLYTISEDPQVNFKYGVQEAEATKTNSLGATAEERKKIVPRYPAAYNADSSCKSYAAAANEFNDIVDDLIDEAILQGNLKFARIALLLYRKNLEQHYDMEGKYENSWTNNDTRTWWVYTEKSKQEAQKRIAAGK